MTRKHLAILLCLSTMLAAEEKCKKEEPPECGNFSLPTSQCPGPLVSFGQNVVDKGDVSLYLFANGFYGKHNYLNDIYPGIVWGIRDDLSLFLNFPFSPGNKDHDDRSKGLEDFSAELEWAFYSTSNAVSYTQATLVGNIAFPTGSGTKVPNTGYGSVSFFVGTTLNYSTVNWMVFTSYGALLTTTRHKTKFGDQIYYELGLERYFPSPCGWIYALLLEFDGIYSWKDRLKGEIDPDSGGNVIYLTPSLWISSKRFIFQFGVGYPIVQHLFGHQSKKFISFDINIGVKL
ncbi:MAG: hypothetical protein JSS30_04090 [Verrucomicrobia bacterium]|nr:hypothetical protein [Verrucomicrobiota bacterium]